MKVTIMERLKALWYSKRINQNKNIKNYLIKIINKHRTEEVTWTNEELFCLNYEDLFEIAVAVVNLDCSIILGPGKDWSCGRDGKVSIARTHSYGKNYTAGITGCKNKKHILALVYEGIQEKFYFFNFPVRIDEHSIPFDLETGDPKRWNRDGPNDMWENYECKTFEDMVLKNNG